MAVTGAGIRLVGLGINVAVGREQLQEPVAIEVFQVDTPREQPPGLGGQAQSIGRGLEADLRPEEQLGRLVREVGDGQVEQPVAIHVADSDPHPGLRHAILI